MQRTYFLACGTLFLLVAGAHLSRLATGWDLTIGGWSAPQWVSVLGFVVPGSLSAWGFTLASRAGTHSGPRQSSVP